MAVILTGGTTDRGWVCPRCERGIAPWARECSCRPAFPVNCAPAGDAEIPRRGPVVALPPEMGGPDYARIFKATRDWEDVWPGLQCCLSSFGGGNETAWASVQFRLTSEDGTAT